MLQAGDRRWEDSRRPWALGIRLALAGLAVMAASCGACGSGGGVPPPGAAPDFDAPRAFADLQAQVDFGSRMPGSPGHAAQLAWMKSTLQPLAARVEEQTFTYTTPFGGPFEGSNLIAVFNPAATGAITLVGAHWDTRPRADEDPDPANWLLPVPGANDGASGVAVLLELARLFAQQPPPHPVYLAFFDAEDSGKQGSGLPYLGFCLGSDYLASHWPGGLTLPNQVIVADLVGGTAQHNPRIPVRTDLGGNDYFDLPKEGESLASAPELVNRIWTLAGALGHTAFRQETRGAMIDDHVPFIAHLGLPAVDLIDFPPPVWHTVDDTPEYCSPDALEQVGDTLAHLLYAD